jgi:uncharacterized protein
MMRHWTAAACVLLLVIPSVAQKIPLINSGEVIETAKQKYDSGKYDDAIALFKSVPKRDTNYVYMLTELAMAYSANKNFNEAITICDAVLEKSSTFRAHALRTKASVYDKNGEFDKAVALLKSANEEFPFDVSLIFNLGITYYNHKDYDKAADCFFKALSINPFHAGSHLNLGRLAAGAGKKTHAMLAFGLYLGVNNKDNERLVFVDKLVSNQFPEEGQLQGLTNVNDCEKLDQIIRARIAMDSKFKIKVQFDAPVVRQYELLFDQLGAISTSGNDKWVNLYLPIYRAIKEQNMIEPFMYHILTSVTNEDVKKWIQKNNKQLTAFYSVANTNISKPRGVLQVAEKFGYSAPVPVWYSDQNVVKELGAKDATGKREGQWYFFHGSQHRSAEGVFKADKKIGTWKYFYPEGTIKSVENYETGEVTVYLPTGEMGQQLTLKDDKINGEITLFHRCGGVSEKLMYVMGQRHGPGQSYYPNGKKNLTYAFLDDKATGEFVKYHENGQLESKINYKEGKYHGPYTEYHFNGQLKTQGEYLNGDLQGTWKYFYSNGKLSRTGRYENNMGIGEWLFYDYDGALNEKRNFDAKGNWQGENITYHEGKTHFIRTFKNDLLVKITWFDSDGKELGTFGNANGTFSSKTFYPSGQLHGHGAYSKGKLHGPWKNYHIHGQLLSEYNYNEGLIDGAGVEYFKNGNKQMTFNHKDNEFDGYFQEFYNNGNVKQQGWFENGKRQQQWLTYYVDGTIEEDNYYLNDQVEGTGYSYDPVGNRIAEHTYEDGSVYDFKNFNEKGEATTKVRTEENRKIYEDWYSNGKLQSHFELQCAHFVNQVQRKLIDGSTHLEYSMMNNSRHGTYTYSGIEGKVLITGQYVGGYREGRWEGYSIPGKIEYHGYYMNGRSDSLWTYYYPSGVISSTSWHKNDERQGVTTFNSPDGKPIVEKYYDQGNLIRYRVVGADGKFGTWTPFKRETFTIVAKYADGKVAWEETYKDGLMDGYRKIYFPNGTVCTEFNYKNNDSHGPSKEFYPNGKLAESKSYKDDQLNGTYEIYNEDGTLYKTETFLNGLQHGKSALYKNGKVIKEIQFLSGFPVN